MYQTRYIWFLTALGLAMSAAVATPAFAQTTPTPSSGGKGWGGHTRMMKMPGVFGTVSAISGTTLTVTGHKGPQDTTGTTYTIDASNATVDKDGASSTLANVATGDMVMVQGTVTGTNVVATTIRDGMPKGGLRGGPGKGAWMNSSSTPQGNGQPIIGGNVTAISGASLTVTNKSNVTYTVDASSATVTKDGASSTVSGIAVGDNVIVQGTVNGNAVVASSVMDHGTTPQAGTQTQGTEGPHRGFFGMLGSFFSHLFGFF